MGKALSIVSMLIIGAMLVAVWTHPSGFSGAVNSVGGVFNTALKTVSGN